MIQNTKFSKKHTVHSSEQYGIFQELGKILRNKISKEKVNKNDFRYIDASWKN